MTEGQSSAVGAAPGQIQEFDIQHDDEFEDFHVTSLPSADQTVRLDLDGDWDDDVNEIFSDILQQQRSLLP
jgi:hypothetical protein